MHTDRSFWFLLEKTKSKKPNKHHNQNHQTTNHILKNITRFKKISSDTICFSGLGGGGKRGSEEGGGK